MRSSPAWPADASTWTETGTATARPRSGRASRPAARASPSSPRQPRSASAALSPPDPQPPAVPVPCSHRKNPPTVEPAAARSDIRAAATPSLSVSNPGQPAPASAATTAMPDHVELHGIASDRHWPVYEKNPGPAATANGTRAQQPGSGASILILLFPDSGAQRIPRPITGQRRDDRASPAGLSSSRQTA